jgi:hypothetical protein
MLLKLTEWQSNWATKKILIIFALLYFIFPFYLLPQILPEGKPLDLYLYYTPTEAYNLIASYGDLNRKAYIMGSATIDMLYPLYYATFISLLLTFFITPLYSKSEKSNLANIIYIRLLPYLVMLIDMTENIAIIDLLYYYPKFNSNIALLASVLTFVKWTLSLICVLLVVYFIVQFYLRDKQGAIKVNL